jgi:D-serine deaminase-like pyridoxal phosphate-dependent protein
MLMIDNEQQVSFLEESASSKQPWDVMIKLDVGSHRAGIASNSDALNRLVQRAEKSSAVSIYGFYCHAGHSYGGRSREEAEETLNVEVSSVLSAAKLLPSDRDLVISVGSTPTAHVVESLKASMPDNIKLELHAGNFPCNDLQQVSTGLVTEAQQAVSVAAEVCSVYPERNEALVNAGVIALSREASAYSGFGRVVGSSWSVVRLSQEHGILGTTEGRKVDEDFKVGQRVELWCNHSCITAAAFHVYYVVDQEGIVRDTWIPSKGW